MSENINLQNEENVIIATFNITVANTIITLKNLNGMTSIDWGDGAVNSELSHTYTQTGEYICKIYDVTSIGSYAFQNCSSLTSVEIGGGVTSIGDSAFEGCHSLTNIMVTKNNTVYQSIDGNLYSKDGTILEHYAIGKTETSFIISNSVTYINDYAFYGCSSLTSVTIPSTVASFGLSAFGQCVNLKEVYLRKFSPYGSAIFNVGNVFGSYPSYRNLIFYVKEQSLENYRTAWNGVIAEENIQPYFYDPLVSTKGLQVYHNALKEKYLDSMATQDWVNERFMKSISQPDYEQNDPAAADYIKNRPFYEISDIISKELVNETISSSQMFWQNLSDVEFTEKDIFDITLNGVEYSNLTCRQVHDGPAYAYGNMTLMGGSNDTGEPFVFMAGYQNSQAQIAIMINENVVDISSGVPLTIVQKTGEIIIKQLDEKYIPDTIIRVKDLDRQQKEIDGKVVIATFNITEANTVITLGNLTGMTSIDWGDDVIDNKLIHTYANAGEYRCKIYDVTTICEHAFSSCSSLTSIEIPDSVTSVGNYAFNGCDSLTSIDIPNSVTSIGERAFSSCDSLTSLVIPDGVTSIGEGMFWSCDSLTSVEIPNSVTSIGVYAFNYCKKLKSIEFKNLTPIEYDDTWFERCDALTHIYVPYGCKQAYIEKWTTDGATQDILDKIVESDREAMMSDVNTLESDMKAYVQQYIKDNFTTLMAEYLNSTEAIENKPTAADISAVFEEEEV